MIQSPTSRCLFFFLFDCFFLPRSMYTNDTGLGRVRTLSTRGNEFFWFQDKTKRAAHARATNNGTEFRSSNVCCTANMYINTNELVTPILALGAADKAEN